MRKAFAQSLILLAFGINLFLLGFHLGFTYNSPEYGFSGRNFTSKTYFEILILLSIFKFASRFENRMGAMIISVLSLIASLLLYFGYIFPFRRLMLGESGAGAKFSFYSMFLDGTSFILILMSLCFLVWKLIRSRMGEDDRSNG